ncbi:MAG: NAD(P)-dependent alcohol dehydrogenase [Actinomycetota bacterium]
MKAIVQHAYGPPGQVLRLEDLPDPEPGPGEITVTTVAAAVNPADWHIVGGEPGLIRLAEGLRRPRQRIPGWDVAGRVRAVGEGVTSHQVGDRVIGYLWKQGSGTFAETVIGPAQRFVRAPQTWSDEEAAGLPLAGVTALQGLRVGGVTEGSRVLIVGASGGVGSFAVPLARHLGAELVTGVCGPDSVERVRSVGAHRVIDHTAEAWATGGDHDVVLHLGGSASASTAARALRRGGVVVESSGEGGGRVLGPLPRLLGGRLRSMLTRRYRVTMLSAGADREDMELLVRLADEGVLTPFVERTWSLVDAPAAISHVRTAHTKGKVVLVP